MSTEFSNIPYSQELLFRILQRSIEVQDQKNRNLVEVFHEEVGAEILAIKMKLQNSNLSQSIKNYTDQNLNALVQKIKLESGNVFPIALEQLGLEQAVLSKVRSFNESSEIEITVQSNFKERLELTTQEARAIFYIIDEVVKNCLTHADCSKVEIKYIHSNPLEIHIADDGAGFEYFPEQMNSEYRGLNEVRCRAFSINASLSFNKLPNKGSIVKIKMNG